MARPRLTRRDAAVGALCAALLATAVWGATHRAPERSASGLPTPEELDSLRRYLRPGPAAPSLDDYSAFLPARPVVEPAAPPASTEPAAAARPPWRVSAILLAGDRPMAIIDDRTVEAGAALAGGARVVSIEHDRVVVRTANGTRFTLRLSAG